MLEDQPNFVCARTNKGKHFDSCGAKPCVIAQLLTNPGAKVCILEVFEEIRFEAQAVFDLLVMNMSPEGIVDHNKILKVDHRNLIRPRAASATAAPTNVPASDNGPAEDPQGRIDFEAAVSRLMAINESNQQQIQDLLSIKSDPSWDSCSVGSSVSSISQYGGGQQRVAAAGLQRLPVVPPTGMNQFQMAPPVAAGNDGQPFNVAMNMNEYNQFKAYQTAKSLGARGRGRQPGNVAGRGVYGGRLPPLQNPSQN
jgi:hypothetical protein